MNQVHNNPDKCTACTSCMVNCPVASVSQEFPGPKMMGPVMERFRKWKGDWDPALEYCANCRNCDITCPSGVSVATLNMLAKAEYYKTHRQRLRDWILSHGEMMAKLSSLVTPLANLGMANPVTRLILKEIGITDKLPLPRYAAKTFYQRFRKLDQRSYPDKVVFFPGCFVNYYEPQVGLDLIAVMQANHYEVIVPENLTCCGSPMVVNGYLEEARRQAVVNIEKLKQLVDEGYPVITCCTSCGLMLKQEYQELFVVEGVETVAAKLYDAAEFLLELYDQGRLNLDFKPQAGRYLYHAPCHLRAQGIGRPGLELIKLLPGLEITDANAGCCGISGNYGFKDDKYAIAMAVGEQLFQTIRSNGADAVITECGTCRLQISNATGVKAVHPLRVICQAYGGN